MRLKLTAKERKLILSLIMDDSGVSKQLEAAKGKPRSGMFNVECSEDSLELLINSLAAEANHSESQRQQDDFDALCERLGDLQDDPAGSSGRMRTLDRAEVSKTVRNFLEEIRPSAENIRAKLDYGFLFFGQSVELLEIRPKMGGRPGKTKLAFAKATYVKTKGIWKVYWMRGNLKWHPYEPSTVRSLEAFLKLVNEDKNACFFG